MNLGFWAFYGGLGNVYGGDIETFGIAVCRPVNDFMGLYPLQAKHHRELGGDGDKERNALLVHGIDSDGNKLGTGGDRPYFDGASIQGL